MATCLLTISFLSILAVETSAKGNLVLKSSQRATLECKQYLPPLDDTEMLCQSRCEMIVLRSWDDCSGLLYIPYSRHFQTCPHDMDYLNRTLSCQYSGMENIPDGAVCSKASVYSRCYRDEWGFMINTPQLVPLSELQVSNTIVQCSEIMGINSTELEYYARNNFDVSERSRCLMRCILIRQGMYSDATGPDLERMFVQCGGYNIDEETFKRNASECIASLHDKCYDNCMLATRIVNDCFPKDSGLLGPFILAAKILTIVGIIKKIIVVLALGALLSVSSVLALATIYVVHGVSGLLAELEYLGLSASNIILFTRHLKAYYD